MTQPSVADQARMVLRDPEAREDLSSLREVLDSAARIAKVRLGRVEQHVSADQPNLEGRNLSRLLSAFDGDLSIVIEVGAAFIAAKHADLHRRPSKAGRRRTKSALEGGEDQSVDSLERRIPA